MSLSTFAELVELRAKAASVFPFFTGLFFSWYLLGSVNGLYAVLFFIAMILFNMTVDTLDNYNDYMHSSEDKWKSDTNIIGRKHISLNLIRTMIVGMIVPSALIGLYLVFEVGLPLLWMGLICFAIGIMYSSGPHPISSTPYGEVASAFAMGIMITLISVYVNSYQMFVWKASLLGQILLASAPLFFWIANIMLANNICDAHEDKVNHRWTIVHYIGVKNALMMFNSANVIAILLVFYAMYIGVFPLALFSILLAIPLIIKQSLIFNHEKIKTKTFVCAVQIMIFGSLSMCIGFLGYWIYTLFAN